MRSLSLPVSDHLSAGLLRGSPRWALILMEMVSISWSMRFQRSCMMSLMMSAPGLPHIERNFLCPHHFCMDERRQAKSERRTLRLSSPLIFASCSTSMPSFLPPLRPTGSIHPYLHLSSSNLQNPAPTIPLSLDPLVAYIPSCKDD